MLNFRGCNILLAGGFKHFFENFHPLGNDPIGRIAYFSNGWVEANHQLGVPTLNIIMQCYSHMFFLWYCWWFRNPKQPPGMVLKPCKSWDKLPTSTGAGFLPSTVCCDDISSDRLFVSFISYVTCGLFLEITPVLKYTSQWQSFFFGCFKASFYVHSSRTRWFNPWASHRSHLTNINLGKQGGFPFGLNLFIFYDVVLRDVFRNSTVFFGEYVSIINLGFPYVEMCCFTFYHGMFWDVFLNIITIW